MKNRTPAEIAAAHINAHADLLINIEGSCSFDDLRTEGDRLIANGHDNHAVQAAIHNVAMIHGIAAK